MVSSENRFCCFLHPSMQTHGFKTLKREQQVCLSPQQGVNWAQAEQTHNTIPQTLLEAGKKIPSFLKLLSNVWIWGDLVISNRFRSLNQLKVVLSRDSHIPSTLDARTLNFWPQESLTSSLQMKSPRYPSSHGSTSKSQLLPIFSCTLVKDRQSFLIRVKCPFPWGKSFLVNVSRQNKIKDIRLRLKWSNQIILQASCFEPLRSQLTGQQLRLFWVF